MLFLSKSQSKLVALAGILSIFQLLPLPLDRSVDPSTATKAGPLRDPELKFQELVKGRYIVRFKQYRHGREHKLAMEEQLGAYDGWKWIERNNAASAYPTDFGLLELDDGHGLIEEIRKLGFVKDVSAEARYSRGLLGDEGDNRGAGRNARNLIDEDQDNVAGSGENKRPGKLFTAMSYEGVSNGSYGWGRQLLLQVCLNS